MIPISYLGIAYAARQGMHVNIDLFTRRLHGKSRTWFEIVDSFLMLVLAVILCWRGLATFADLYSTNSVTQGAALLEYPIAIFIPIGGAVLCLEIIAILVKQLASLHTSSLIKIPGELD